MTDAKTTEPRDAVSVNEFARRCGVCRRTIERAIKANQITSVRFGRRHLIPRSELARLFPPMPMMAM